jgi:hypothetical protein
MGLAATSLQGVAAIVSLICFILAILKMFQGGSSGLAILCIVLAFCGGIGILIAFVVGWMRSSEWNFRNVMIIWTIALVIGLIGGGLGATAS